MFPLFIFFFLFTSDVIFQSMLWLNIIFQRPIWLSLGFFLVMHFSKDFFSYCAEYSFTVMRLYYLWHVITMLFVCVFCSNIFENKEKYFSRSGREIDYLKKKRTSVFNILAYFVYIRLAPKLWKSGKWIFFLESLKNENQEQPPLSCSQVMTEPGWWLEQFTETWPGFMSWWF